MKILKAVIILLMTCLACQLAAQDVLPYADKCALKEIAEDAMENMDEKEMRKMKGELKRYERKQKRTYQLPFAIPLLFPRCNPNRTIPIVFHVVHSCGTERVNASQIQGALKDINDDFNAKNADRLLSGEPFFQDQATVGLNFVLAEKDPYGNYTSGINYIEQEPGLSREDIQRMTGWPRDKYLNVWVIPKLSGASGYAFYPYLVDDDEEAYKDGIVIVHRYLGTTGTADSSAENYHGRRHILTHEIGHWLGLEHAWGDKIVNGVPRYQTVGAAGNCANDDKVCDTPNTKGDASIVYSRPIFAEEKYIANNTDLPHTCASGPECGGDYDNIFNFMDYGCEVMFTNGQKERMGKTLCSTVAQRLRIGTPKYNESTLLTSIDSRRPKILTDEYFFFESPTNDGSIENCIDIQIRGGSGAFLYGRRNGLLIPNVHFKVINANGHQVQIRVHEDDYRRATICLTGKSQKNEADDNITNMTIKFIGSSINGQDVLNRDLSGLKIVYKDQNTLGYNNYNSDDYTKDAKVIEYEHFDQDAFFSDVIGELGVVADVERDNDTEAFERFLLYAASSYDVKALCYANTKDIAMLYEGEVISGTIGAGEYTYKTVRTGLESQALSFDPNDWQGKTGYIGISATSGCNGATYYAWVRVGMAEDGDEFYVYDMGYPTAPNLAIKTSTKPLCTASAERTDISGIGRIEIDDFVNQSGLDKYDAYQDFTNQIISLEAGERYDLRFVQTGSGNSTTKWYIWVDFNQNGCFSDPNELIFNSQLETSSEIRKEFALSNHKLLPDDVFTGTYTMRIASNPRNRDNPCEVWRAGEREDYTIEVENDNCQQPINASALNINFIDNTAVELSAPMIEDNDKVGYYFFYWGKKTENMSDWKREIETSPRTRLDDLEENTVYGFYLKVQYRSSYCGGGVTSEASSPRFFKTTNQVSFLGNPTNTE